MTVDPTGKLDLRATPHQYRQRYRLKNWAIACAVFLIAVFGWMTWERTQPRNPSSTATAPGPAEAALPSTATPSSPDSRSGTQP
jgi:hypothetical protein